MPLELLELLVRLLAFRACTKNFLERLHVFQARIGPGWPSLRSLT